MKIKYIIICLLSVLSYSCVDDNGAELPSVEQRVEEAINELRETLTSSPNGWKIDYRPTSQTGGFLILMDFNNDGTVRVQSDLGANDGEFIDHLMSYRIDGSQGIELVFETYGVFHYLFELRRASFGGEFEFIYEGEEGDDLIFSSKTDQSSDITTVTFVEAASTDSQLISTSAVATLSQGVFQSDNLGNIGSMGNFNFHLKDQDYLLSATFDLENRKAKLLSIGKGSDQASVIANSMIQSINVETSFTLRSERLILDDVITVQFDGSTIEIDEIPITSPLKLEDSFCSGQQDSVVRFSSSGSDLGSFDATSSLFQSSNDFVISSDNVYSLNHVFLYDENDNSLADQIEAVFPDVAAFQWYQESNVADSVFNGIGFVTLDEFNNVEFFLRGFDYTQNGNLLEISFNGNDLITADNPTTEQLEGLDELTDLLLSGGNVYVIELLNIDGLFEFYNPCNKHKGFLL